ncbi:MAG: magnesium chelatase subunit H [Pseudomonadota bacterium]
MPKRTSHAEQDGPQAAPVRVVLITLDHHLARAVAAAEADLQRDLPGATISLHAASDWAGKPERLAACKDDIACGDIIIATMLFMEDHINAVLPDLQARRDSCDAMLGCMSAGEVIRLTRLGKFDMGARESGMISLLKKLRGSSSAKKSSGAHQIAMLKRIPRILRFIPGKAQDVRSYFIAMQYWLAASDDNIAALARFLISKYANEARAALADEMIVNAPIDYPEVGIYHPDLPDRITSDVRAMPRRADALGRVGLVLMRSYVLSRDTGHYDGAIRALEAAGLEVVPVFATGLDARPALEAFFLGPQCVSIDALVSLTGFSLVGGPAYNNAAAAEEILAQLDVPYVAAQSLELQSLEAWERSRQGLMPVEATMMLAIPELDGATSPIVFGGRRDAGASDVTSGPSTAPVSAMQVHEERAGMLARRVRRLVEMRNTPVEERRVAITLFNFPPNAGATGTAAFLGVFESLHNTLKALSVEGYDVTVPDSVDALRRAILEGNAATHGTDANVVHAIPVDDHVRREPHLSEIEAQWGAAPGRHLTDGRSLFVLGQTFGNVLVAVQPGFGYEGDPMRLLFEEGFSPTHAFSAFYRYLREDYAAHAVLHFGTHGALEFMPGKQTGLSAACWPDRLIGDLPNIYLYAANNPSEGTIAKRRGAATLVSYMTPPLATAGLYKGLGELKHSLERWRGLAPDDAGERARLSDLIVEQARAVDLVPSGDDQPALSDDALTDWIGSLSAQILELEYSLIPHGLHVVGRGIDDAARTNTLQAVNAAQPNALDDEMVLAVAAGERADTIARGFKAFSRSETRQAVETLVALNDNLQIDAELPALMSALDGRFIRPVAGGDLVRSPHILPSGRNIHGFDPFKLPSAFAVREGADHAQRLLARHMAEGHRLPECIALVLWGTDNLKSEGGPISQMLALLGAQPRFDSYGRLAGAELIPLDVLKRPRIDVVATLSGIFRDLLPLQTRMLADAAYLAAIADEPEDENYVRKHARAYQSQHDCDIETASLRVFSNAESAYGSNVNHLIDSGAWAEEGELGQAFTSRKCFAYGRGGDSQKQSALLGSMLGHVELAYQNIESVELGVTTIDHYFDTLGGIGRAVQDVRGEETPVYLGDQTQGEAKVRTLSEQVALETRTRTLNPKWFEGMLEHGYEGVRQIEAHVTNTMGWSATTGQVDPWVYKQITQTYVLDEEMRARLAELNPKASVRVANRLIEAHERDYWQPDDETLAALQSAGEELEDRLEGVI